MKKNFFLFIVFIFSFYTFIFASDKYAGDFLNNGASARAIALGKTGFINNFDASSVFWNPALLSNLSGQNLSFMLSKPFANVNGIQYHTLFFASNIYNDIFGFGLIYESADEMKKVTNTGLIQGDFSARDIAFLSAYSKKLSENLSAGLNFKIVNQKIDTYKGTGFGADLGLKFSLSKNLHFGSTLKNILPPSIKLNSKTEKFPLRAEFGSNLILFENLNCYYGFSYENSDFMHHIGFEYLIKNFLDLRTGYDDETDAFSAGIGVKFVSFQFDYSYKTHKTLGASHILSFNLFNF
ncbi:MAG TPA: PorV/PorQ family protein [bacterium]|nr:PorV/PorQ family protein [bacterium]HOL47590.1 PorV/PorQ family protein [bacterium]HPQ18727.1 PorV/PorQ family protein [bacterium]